MRQWLSRGASSVRVTAPDGVRSGKRGRRLLAAGAATATLVVSGSLATVGTASAAGTPLRTLAEGVGRYFGSDMTGNLLSQSTVTTLQAQQFDMITPGNERK